MSAWSRKAWGAGLAALALLATAAGAQEGASERVEVRVTAQIGGSVYLDRGQDALLRPGDRVRLQPAGAVELDATVRAVSRETSRAELPPGASVPIGTRGEVLVPASRREIPQPAPEEGGDAAAKPPAHPPWNHPPEEWDETMPLLAPAQGLKPEERPTRWRGRAFAQLDGTMDHDRDGDTLHARTGLEAVLENPFGRGGGLAVDLEAIARRVSGVDDDEDERGDDEYLRLQRLSYYVGGVRGRPGRLEVGRFLHSEFPELGVLDGIEVVRRTSGGHHAGASVGFLPEPTPEMDTGDDAQVSLFYRYFRGPERELALGTAVQKTWHHGEPDRDLWITTLDWRPSERWYASATAWVDFYTSGDDLKDSGPELTELHATLGWRPGPRGGASLSLSRLRWPELLRNEFFRETPEQVEDYDLRRASLHAWRHLGRRLRLWGRADAWEDREDDGLGGEVGVALRGALGEDSEVHAALFDHDGAFTGVRGLRLGAARWRGPRGWRLTYELSRQEQEGFVGDQEELLQHAVRLSLDLIAGERWLLSLSGEQVFGDEVDATRAGLFLQRRF